MPGSFLVFGLKHLRHIICEFLAYYHSERPHQAKDNLPLSGPPPGEETPLAPAGIQCSQRLGGLLKHYYRKAA